MSTTLVAGIGNIFFGDDGFGPEVARRLVADPASVPAGVRVVDYGIRGLHLAYELLDGVDALVLVDALPGDNPPGTVTTLSVGEDDVLAFAEGTGVDAHALHPAAVLANVLRMGGELPPTYVVGVRPANLAEGIGLSAPVTAAVEEAVRVVRQLLDERIGVGTCA